MKLASQGSVIALAAALTLLGGCATITTGHSQPVVVDTDPHGAACRLTRDEKDVAVVNPTPGTATVSKGFGRVDVQCTKDGYQTTVGVLAADFQAMTLGNVILGGIIGIAVDAASGAMVKYPESVKYTLVPVSFPTESARDAYFARLRETLLKEGKEAEDAAQKRCVTPEACTAQLKAAAAATQIGLDALEAKRQLVKVEQKAATSATPQGADVQAAQ